MVDDIHYEFLMSLALFWGILVDMLLEVGDSDPKLADWGGGSPLQEGGPKSVS